MSLAAVAGVAITRARVTVPAWGLWWAEIDLAEDETLTGQVTITLADLTLVGTVWTGGPAFGRASYRVVGGYGGWGRAIVAKGYADDAGVKAATVLRDAAAAVGERLYAEPTGRLGPHFARPAAPPSRLLHQLFPQGWHVGFDGATYLTTRAATTYQGDGTRTRLDPAGLVVEVATEEIATLVPGVQVDGSTPATDVEYDLDDKRLTVRVYSGPRPSRRLDALRRIVDAIDPRRHYRGLFEFRVVSQTGNRLNLQPMRVASGLPDLARVPVRPGMAGQRATVALGERVLVAFVDADLSRPVVVAHEEPDATGWSPTLLELGDSGGDFAALAGVVDANFQTILTTFSTWVPVPQDGGASLKTKFGTVSFSSTAATKVKVK